MTSLELRAHSLEAGPREMEPLCACCWVPLGSWGAGGGRGNTHDKQQGLRMVPTVTIGVPLLVSPCRVGTPVCPWFQSWPAYHQPRRCPLSPRSPSHKPQLGGAEKFRAEAHQRHWDGLAGSLHQDSRTSRASSGGACRALSPAFPHCRSLLGPAQLCPDPDRVTSGGAEEGDPPHSGAASF